ncbi:hypothetical protein [Streptosporangium sp. NPDC002721]|uniref:hypothetical protein n=1 Tax=Streptosporangium sp. NPDC002721 TaxID=3366188 RepID=UPI00369C630B
MTETPGRRVPAAGPLMTAGRDETDGPPAGRGRAAPPRGAGTLRGWAPAASMTALTAAVTALYGVSVPDMILFGLYVVLGVGLPGVLLLRLLYRGRRTLAEEMALGLALGYAVEVLAYAGARALGAPLLVLAWPIGACLLFLAVPRLRRHWTVAASRRERAPGWWSWFLAALTAYLLAWSAVAFFRLNALSWPALGRSFPDMPFHLALVGELRHHMPPTVPMVAGEPLSYHWFVYAHLAAASWVTGVEPLVLLFRLGMFPVLAAFVVLAGMTGRRVTGSWAGAALTVAGTVLVATPSLYLGSNGAFTWGGVPDLMWASPTQTFGGLMFAPVVPLLLDLLERRRRTAGHWALLGVFLVAVAGAKATYLPLLGAGLLAVVAAGALRRRRPPGPVLAALGMTAACFLFAQFVLFGGARQALVVDPFSFMETVWREMTGAGDGADPPPLSIPGMVVVFLLCWAVTWGGISGLLSRPRLLARPAVALVLGIGAAGLGAALLLGHPGRSQLFFLWGAYPYLAAATALGIVTLARRARQSRRATLCAAGAGLAAAYLIPLLCGVRIPLKPGTGDTVLYLPYAVLLATILAAAAVLAVTSGRLRAWSLVVTALAVVGLPAVVHARLLWLVAGREAGGPPPVTAPPPEGALDAGRWLRAHSDPGDLVATNAHCRWGREEPCDGRHFWVAALSERRVLVEGWTYTSRNTARWRPELPALELPFWDDRLIALNDAVFEAPTAEAVRELRERHGVSWLFADEHRGGPVPGLGAFATPRFRSGGYAVYRLPGGPA